MPLFYGHVNRGAEGWPRVVPSNSCPAQGSKLTDEEDMGCEEGKGSKSKEIYTPKIQIPQTGKFRQGDGLEWNSYAIISLVSICSRVCRFRMSRKVPFSERIISGASGKLL